MSNVKPWERSLGDTDLRLSDSLRKSIGTNELTRHDLNVLIRNLGLLGAYFEQGKECRATVDACIEVAYGLKYLWTRDDERQAVLTERARVSANNKKRRGRNG